MKFSRIALALTLAALPAMAEAHVGFHADGVMAGLAHPFTGLDHILAMVAVGFWAATLGGKSRWIVPGAFVSVMAFGGLLGIGGVGLPMVETAIAMTVALLGLLVAFEVKVPVVAASGIVGACALFHGHAHGAELPAMANGLTYVASFLGATIALHLAGIGVAALRFGNAARIASRIGGATIALSGAALLAG